MLKRQTNVGQKPSLFETISKNISSFFSIKPVINNFSKTTLPRTLSNPIKSSTNPIGKIPINSSRKNSSRKNSYVKSPREVSSIVKSSRKNSYVKSPREVSSIVKSSRKNSSIVDSSIVDSPREDSSIVDSSIVDSSRNSYVKPSVTIKEDASDKENYTLVTRDRDFILAIDHNSIDEYSSRIRPDLEVNIRNMAFIMVFDERTQEIEIRILQSNDKDNDVIRSLSPQLIVQHKIDIITNFLREAQKMNIPLQFPCIGYSNVPHSDGDTISAYHKDNIVSIVIHGSIKNKLDDIISNFGISRRVDLSFFKYKSDCVSTTIKIFYNGEEIEIRFNACPTTTLAINNIINDHSKPFIIKQDKGKTYTADRTRLNKKILSGIHKHRSLNRIGVKFLSPDQLTEINRLGGIYLTTFRISLPEQKREFFVRTLSTQLGKTILEGGKRKRKRKLTKKNINNISKRI